jgi:hypothetical protein
MGASLLRLVPRQEPTRASTYAEQQADDQAILSGYLDTFTTQGFVASFRERVKAVITRFFADHPIPDDSHPDGQRPLFVWEAMEPGAGRVGHRAVARTTGNAREAARATSISSSASPARCRATSARCWPRSMIPLRTSMTSSCSTSRCSGRWTRPRCRTGERRH